jgi:hypothetical protein
VRNSDQSDIASFRECRSWVAILARASPEIVAVTIRVCRQSRAGPVDAIMRDSAVRRRRPRALLLASAHRGRYGSLGRWLQNDHRTCRDAHRPFDGVSNSPPAHCVLRHEVLCFRMRNDDRGCALLGLELKLLGDAHADATEVEEFVELGLVLKVGTCRVAP